MQTTLIVSGILFLILYMVMGYYFKSPKERRKEMQEILFKIGLILGILLVLIGAVLLASGNLTIGTIIYMAGIITCGLYVFFTVIRTHLKPNEL